MNRKYLTHASLIAIAIAFIMSWGVFFTGCDDDDNGPVDGGSTSSWAVVEPLLEGNHFRSVVFVDENTGWLVGKEGIVLKTQDGGVNWMLERTNSVSDLWDIQFFDADTGWLVGEEGTIQRTMNGGRSWSDDDLQVTEKAVYGLKFASGRKGFVVGEDTTLLYSIDGGRRWNTSKVAVGTERYNLYAIDIFDTTAIVVGEDGLILNGSGYDKVVPRLVTDSISADTFLSIDTTLDIDTVIVPPDTTIVIDTLTDSITYVLDTLLLTVDTVWSNWTMNTSVTGQALRSVELVDAGTAWAVGDNGTIIKTTDGGGSWEVLDTVVADDLQQVHFTSQSTGWIVGRNGTILTTSNGGDTWSIVDTDFNYDLFDMSFPASGEIWLVGSLALFNSSDGGSSWEAVPTGTALLPSFNDVAFADGDIGLVVGNSDAVLRTEDGGDTWEYRRRGTQFTSSTWFREVQFLNSSVAWCGGGTGVLPYDGYLLKTTDGGDTWEERIFDNNTPPALGLIRDLHFVGDSTGWLIDIDQILHTTDGGATWQSQSPMTTEELNAVQFIDSVTGWIVGSGGSVLKTENGGTNWFSAAVRDSIVSIDTTFDSEVPDSIIAIDTTRIELPTAPPINLYDVHFVDANTGWAVGDAGSVLRTDTGGQLWVEQTTTVSEKLSAVHFIDTNTGWIVGAMGTILNTTNGGTTWTVQPPPDFRNLGAVFPLNANDVWIVGENGLILSTTSGGN